MSGYLLININLKIDFPRTCTPSAIPFPIFQSPACFQFPCTPSLGLFLSRESLFLSLAAHWCWGCTGLSSAGALAAVMPIHPRGAAASCTGGIWGVWGLQRCGYYFVFFFFFFFCHSFFCCFPSMNGAFTRFHLGLPLSVLWPWSQIPQKQLKEPSVRRFLSMGWHQHGW